MSSSHEDALVALIKAYLQNPLGLLSTKISNEISTICSKGIEAISVTKNKNNKKINITLRFSSSESKHGVESISRLKHVLEPVSDITDIKRLASNTSFLSGVGVEIPDDSPLTLAGALQRTVNSHPEQLISYYHQDGTLSHLTYKSLFERATHFACGLTQAIGSGTEPVVLISGDVGDYLTAFWGCVLARRPTLTVMLSADYALGDQHALKLEQALAVLNTTCAVCCDVGSERLNGFAPVSGKLLTVSSLVQHPVSDVYDQRLAQVPVPIFYQLTSGSTGKAKVIAISETAILAQIHSVNQCCGYSAQDVSLNWLPYDHVIALLAAHIHDVFLGRAQVHLPTAMVTSDPLQWLHKMSGHKATHCFAPNFIFKLVLEQLSREKVTSFPDLSHVKQIVSGGEAVSPVLVHSFLQAFADCGLNPHTIQPSYGMAEAAAGVSFEQQWSLQHSVMPSPSSNGVEGVSSLGKLLPGLSLRIVDRQRQVVQAGEVGEIELAGLKLSHGGSDWFKTGDLGFVDQGRVFVSGRVKDLIIVNGVNFYSHQLESAVALVDGVKPGWVAAVADIRCTPEGVAVFFVSDRDSEPELRESREVMKRIRSQLARQFGIGTTAIVMLSEPHFPKTSIGKIRRNELQQQLSAGNYDEWLATSNLEAGEESPRVLEGELEELKAIWCDVLGIEHCDLKTNFFEMGGSSVLAAQLIAQINQEFGTDFEPVLLFETPTISLLAERMWAKTASPTNVSPSCQSSNLEHRERDIAIIGMAGQFSSAPDVETFWQKLLEGEDMMTTFSSEALSLVPDATLSSPDYIRRGGKLESTDVFDAAFFNYPLKDAEFIDPQARLLHQFCWHALENAGYVPATFDGKIGLYLGSSTKQNRSWIQQAEQYMASEQLSDIMAFETLADRDFAATRIAYALDLTGPAVTLQTACSTGLVAVHNAIQSLRSEECDIALAGAASVSAVAQGYYRQAGMMLSETGVCRPFDASADGTVFTDGAGVVALKPLERAMKDKDNVLAVIKGCAVNNDGHQKAGYLAPGVAGQADVIEQALSDAGVEPDSVSYIETHGTGTLIGDPIEVNALNRVFSGRKTPDCIIGSVKSNIGHTEAAAGMAGLFKTVLALRHGEIPATLNYQQANPHIDFSSLPFKVSNQNMKWQLEEGVRRAGVSAFGIGGTNAHAILEQAPERIPNIHLSSRSYLFPFSAKSALAFHSQVAQLSHWIRNNKDMALEDVAFTLSQGREHFAHRRALVSKDRADLLAQLEQGVVPTTGETKPIYLLFPGQGAQYSGMFSSLYRQLPSYRDVVDHCLSTLPKPLSASLLPLITDDTIHSPFTDTRLVQPALFICQYSVGKVLLDCGIKPSGMMGHSIGEYAVAALAGVMSADDALMLVVRRAELMAKTGKGAMLGVSLPETQATSYLSPTVSIAAVNGPSQCVLSGEQSEIDRVRVRLQSEGIACQPLPVEQANHSHLMEPILAEYFDAVSQITLQKPRIPYVSTCTGQWAGIEVAQPEYWTKHLRQPVLFEKGLQCLLSNIHAVFVDIGPGKTLGSLVRRHPSITDTQSAISVSRHAQESVDELSHFLAGIAQLYEQGCDIDWRTLPSQSVGERIGLPLYPFEPQRFSLVTTGETNYQRFDDLFAAASGAAQAGKRQRPNLDTPYREPTNNEEQMLLKIWEEELGFTGLGVDDELYAIGGDSLVLLRLVNKINQAFSVGLTVASATETKTIAEQAVLVALLASQEEDDEDALLLDLGELL